MKTSSNPPRPFSQTALIGSPELCEKAKMQTSFRASRDHHKCISSVFILDGATTKIISNLDIMVQPAKSHIRSNKYTTKSSNFWNNYNLRMMTQWPYSARMVFPIQRNYTQTRTFMSRHTEAATRLAERCICSVHSSLGWTHLFFNDLMR